MTSDIGIGIDLGTTNCCVSIWRNEKHEIVYNGFYNTFPSIIAYTQSERYIGTEAKHQQYLNPKNVFYEVKRLIGKNYSDAQMDLELLSYNVTHDENNKIQIKSDFDKYYYPEEISGALLSYLKTATENYLNMAISNVVITIPAYFNDAQREATRIAAEIAGLNCIRIINEPTAAVLAYGLQNSTNKDFNVLVCDIGGGTTDISLVNISNNVFDVLASSGNSHLGGTDFDHEIMRYLINLFKETHNINTNLNLDALILQKLKSAAEHAKCELSRKKTCQVKILNFYQNLHLQTCLTQDILATICHELICLCLQSVKNVLEMANVNKTEIDEIVLVGGATRMPLIKNELEKYFNKTLQFTVNPDEVVAIGASIQAYMLQNQTSAFSQKITLLDVTPLSLGVKVMNGLMSVVIPRNSYIPTSITREYTNSDDYETNIEIEIYEGERMMTCDNFLLGKFILQNIESAPKATCQINITFRVDENGITTVSAEDLKTDARTEIKVSGNKNKLSQDKIQNLIESAISLQKQDQIIFKKKLLQHSIQDLFKQLEYAILNDVDNPIPESSKLEIKTYIASHQHLINCQDLLTSFDLDYATKIQAEIQNKYELVILNTKSYDKTLELEQADQTDQIKQTNVFEDEPDINMNQIDKIKTYDARNTLVELCNELNQMIKNEQFNHFMQSDLEHLTNIINETFIWAYVKTGVNYTDYQLKINEINELCNTLSDKYPDKITLEQAINIAKHILNFMQETNNINTEITQLATDIINKNINYEHFILQLNDKFNDFCQSLSNSGTNITNLI